MPYTDDIYVSSEQERQDFLEMSLSVNAEWSESITPDHNIRCASCEDIHHSVAGVVWCHYARGLITLDVAIQL